MNINRESVWRSMLAVIITAAYVGTKYSLWGFLHRSVLFEFQQLALDAFDRIGKLPVIQLSHFALDPIQQVGRHARVRVFQTVSFHHLADDL
jgi:hypothetical protein